MPWMRSWSSAILTDAGAGTGVPSGASARSWRAASVAAAVRRRHFMLAGGTGRDCRRFLHGRMPGNRRGVALTFRGVALELVRRQGPVEVVLIKVAGGLVVTDGRGGGLAVVGG